MGLVTVRTGSVCDLRVRLPSAGRGERPLLSECGVQCPGHPVPVGELGQQDSGMPGQLPPVDSDRQGMVPPVMPARTTPAGQPRGNRDSKAGQPGSPACRDVRSCEHSIPCAGTARA